MSELKNGTMLPLGFGNMRLPASDAGDVDTDLFARMADQFLERGFVYFDTAYAYHSGKAEGAFKTAVVDRYSRDRYRIATKLPIGANDTLEDLRGKLETSLERLGCGYVDYWLLHSLRKESMERADSLGVWDMMKEYKAAGKAKHIGFSFHDTADVLDAYLAKHPEVEFVQLQVNYLDWEDEHVQARKCCEVVQKYGLPIIVMEPIKGGSLSTGNEEVKALMQGESPAALALRWVAQIPGVKMILSGMNEESQMEENTRVMAKPEPLSDAQNAALEKAAALLHAVPRVPCTSCKYCVDGCPMHINIPWIIGMYNDAVVYQNTAPLRNSFQRFIKDGGKPSQCIGCGQCEGICPQHLNIPEIMKKAAEILE